jgi:intein/homing endonuclease
VDLAVIAVPAAIVPKVLDECGRKGVKAVIIISGGFAEVGNRELEDDCYKLIRKYKMRTIGPNCISGPTPIMIKNSGQLKYKEIGELVDQIIEQNKEKTIKIIDTYVVPVKKDIKVLSWDGKNLVFKRITKVMKRCSQRNLLKIIISGGKEIICSQDHPFIVKKNNTLRKIPCNRLKVGSEAIITNIVDESRKLKKDINLVEEFLAKTTKEQRRDIKVRYKGKNYSLEKFKSFGFEYENARIRTIRSRINLPIKLPISEELCKVLGFFIADGNYKKDFLHIGYVKNSEEEATLRKCINKVFGSSSLGNCSAAKEIKFGRRIGQLLFKHVFEIKQGAENKSIPDFIFSAKPEMIAHFLSGLFSGDGTIYKYKNKYSATIYVCSISKKLISQTHHLLSIINSGPFYVVRKKRNKAKIKGVECKAKDLYFLRSDSKQAIKDMYNTGFRFLNPNKDKKLNAVLESRVRKNFGRRIKANLYPRKIIGIEKVNEPIDVYDFEVEDTHNFVAGQILTSNCIGIYDPSSCVDTFFLPRYKLERPKAGSIAFISQSGALGSVVLDWMAMKGYRISKFISYGNAIDVDEADLINYLNNDPQTKVICCYFEGLKQGRRFYETLKSISAKKPVIIIKGGTTQEGTSAVSSHTGSLAGSKEIHSAAFKQAGGIQAQTLEELFDFARVMAAQPKPEGNRVQIITDGGGYGVLTTDWVVENKLRLAKMDKQTQNKLKRIFPPHVVIKNPLDLTGDADVERYRLAINAAIKDTNIDMIIIIALFQIPTLTADITDVIAAGAEISKKPIVVLAAGGRFTEVLKKTLEDSGVPTFSYPEKAAAALRALHEFGQTRRKK